MTRPIVFVLTAGAIVRLVVWLTHGQDLFAQFQVASLWVADCRGVLADPLFVLAWDHARPPLFALLEIGKCGLRDIVAPWHFSILLVSVADTFAAALLYAALRRLSIGIRVSMVAAVIWSIGLIAWEYYRYGGSHNHLNIAIIMLLVYAAVRRGQEPGMVRDFGCAAAAALTVAASGAGLMLVPLIAVVALPWHLSKRRIAASLVAALSLPAVLYIGIASKNEAKFGVFSTSGYLSVNLGQYAFISLGYDEPGRKLVPLLADLNASQWWHWCFQRHSQDATKTHPYLKGLQGQCIDFTDPRDIRLGLGMARRLQDGRFEHSLAKDLETAEKAPWAMRFPQKGLTSATEIAFNDTSKRLYAALLRSDPLRLVRTFLMANRSFFLWGPLMFDGVHHEPQLVLAPTYINWIATGIGLFMILSVCVGAIYACVIAMQILKCCLQQPTRRLSYEMPKEALITGLILSFFIVATVMNGVSCCENGRQFQSMGVIPFLTGVAIFAPFIRRFLNEKF